MMFMSSMVTLTPMVIMTRDTVMKVMVTPNLVDMELVVVKDTAMETLVLDT